MTICVQDHKCVLGEITNGVVELTPVGGNCPEVSQSPEPQRTISPRDVELRSLYASRPLIRQYHRYQHIIPTSVGSIVRAYKSAVTLWCRRNGYGGFKSQRNFCEIIVRTDADLRRIREYMIRNPANWGKDGLKLIRCNMREQSVKCLESDQT